MTRLNENKKILGTVVVNQEGFPEITNMDSLSAVKYSLGARELCSKAQHAVRCIRADDEVVAVRLVTVNTEVLMKPDTHFHIVAIMHRHS